MSRSTAQHHHVPGSRLIVVMGVSGAGKSTVGKRLAERLGLPFADGDDFHPPSNVALMSAGKPLTDADREPWLRAVGDWIADQQRMGGAVVACSALKRSYRDTLRARAGAVFFVHLTGTRDELAARMNERSDHFMPPSLLDSQLGDLEPLDADEQGATVDVTSDSPDQVVDRVVRVLVPVRRSR